MTDYELITNLSYEYTFLLDKGDFAGVGKLFQYGRMTFIWLGGQAEDNRGEKEVSDFYIRSVATYDASGKMIPMEEKGNALTRHLISNNAIYINDDKATGESYFQVLQAPPKLPYQIIIGGRYSDSFEKVNNMWRFTEKVIRADYANDVIHHGRQFADMRSR